MFVQSIDCHPACRWALAWVVARSRLVGKAGSPIEYLDAPEFKVYWDADAKGMVEAVRRIGKVE